MKRLLLAATAAATLATPLAALADPPQHLVDSATLTVESMMDGSEGHEAAQFLRHAKAVLVCPNIFRAGFMFGGEGGGCVMVARGNNGGWSDPAFFGMGGGSFGLQIGLQSAQVMMMVMTDNGLNALLNSQFKFGADAGLTVATLGAGVNGSMSTGLTADIISFSKSEGLYGGISLAGSILSNDSKTEQAYYGAPLDARQIVVDMQGSNPGANPLREMLTRYGG
ncbi:lipid-binding SYLF domain-containing protein [Acidocella sp.]|jgi:lipid-binding SYLF domain-containing protein|uniref:lipid-binding SYLF domain-containing protein n=1 Tax=Acidocella sp. TaxID=50710 RepID=UPI002F3F779F